MLEYHVTAKRLDEHGSVARCKAAEITLDTDTQGREDAFNPAELFLAAIAACMIKGIERVAPKLNFSLRGVEISIKATRQDSPPKMEKIEYVLTVDTDENDRRLEVLHINVMNFGTIYNTVAEATELVGEIRRKV